MRWLTVIAALVLGVNLVAVGIYYGSDSRALDAEVIADQFERLENALVGRSLPQSASVRSLYAEYPKSYAFALVDRDGFFLDAMNDDLIPPGAADLFADDWITRLDRPEAPLLAGGHEFYGRDDGLRAVFVMTNDPARLLWRAYLAEFYKHVWLPILPLVLVLVGANTFLIRRGLASISVAAAWARNLRPGAPGSPPDIRFPAEIADLVSATQRSIERLEEAFSAEKRRAAETAHALRTPVSVLIARLDALPPGETTDRLRADLSALARTVQQVLASSRAEVFGPQDMATVDLRLPAETVTAALAPFAYEHGLELCLNAPGTPVFANAIPEGVELALFNLVENAILHGGVGPVEIKVGPSPAISVRDYGAGLPDGFDNCLFQPFWRAPGAVQGGAGLGLAIVDRLQRVQGGGIQARNTPGGGAEFEMTWLAVKK